MLTSQDCYNIFGDPVKNEAKHMIFWNSTDMIQKAFSWLPKRIYMNKFFAKPLENALNEVITEGLANKLKSFNGVFNIRSKTASSSTSLHSWGLAIDFNAAENPFGVTPKMDKLIVDIFKRAGFDWGGNWKRPDGMHFQLKKEMINNSLLPEKNNQEQEKKKSQMK